MSKESSKSLRKENSKYYKTTSIRLPKDLWRKIKIEAIKRDMTISELIEFALNQVVFKESSIHMGKESSIVVSKESSKSLRKENSIDMSKEILKEEKIVSGITKKEVVGPSESIQRPATVGDAVIMILSEKARELKELLKMLLDMGFSSKECEKTIEELVKKDIIEIGEVEMGKYGKKVFVRLKEKEVKEE